MAKATFAAGCFWGVEDAFRHIKGVNSTTVGYTGGTLKNPTYEDVCTGRTGHAEGGGIDYDPAQVTYEQLLGNFLGKPRSDYAESPRTRHRHAIPIRDLL